MNTLIGGALMAGTVLLFRYLKLHQPEAEQLRLTIPGIWIALPLLMIVGFITGAVMVFRGIEM